MLALKRNRKADEARASQSLTAAQRRTDRARKRAAAPFFFGKQILLFMALALFIVIFDLFIYIGVAIFEEDSYFNDATPNTTTRETAESLTKNDDGTYTLDDAIASKLDEANVWAILISNDGEVVWQHNAPASALRDYTLSDTAVFSRLGYFDDSPCFVWQRDDGLVVCAYPHNSYLPFPISYLPYETYSHIPFYILATFLIDSFIVFLAYLISRRRVLKSVAPIVESLDKLAHGKPVHVEARGDMREVGESINAASAVMRRKDEARRRWVSGVSHDIRTPLAISMGHAESIAHADDVPEEARQSAQTILRQSARIRDLVSDLNIASKLEYDMQPLDVQPCTLSKMVRSVAVDYINDGLDDRFDIEVDVAPDVEGAKASVDERLLTRALRNLIDNSMRHNESGCCISLTLSKDENSVRIRVSDDGAGLSREAIARLNLEAEAMSHAPADLDSIANGPTPPPHFDEYGPAASRASDIAPEYGDSNTPDHFAEAPTLSRAELTSLNEHGLGLSLVARIAAAHGGAVEFSGAPNEGFTATMTFPLA